MARTPPLLAIQEYTAPMLHLQIDLTGTSPMMCHNIRLADPDDKIVREIGSITSKRKKTEEDRKEIAKLEWFGGLYVSPGISGPSLPTANARQCFIRAARVNRLGAAVERSVYPTDFHVPIIYDGPTDLNKLFELESFHDRRAVGIAGSRTMRTRPVFANWAISLRCRHLEDVLDLDDLKRIIDLAGLIQGLGDNRINGFGRFEGKVTVL